jgi:hypothetical protein
MPLLLHAVVPAEDMGLREPLLGTVAGPLLGIATAEDTDMLEHHRVVQELHERFSACLPARFPTYVEDAETLRTLLTEREEALWAALERVRGRSELAVTAMWTRAPTVAEGGPGRRYLLRLQWQQRVAREVADEVERVARPEAQSVQRALNPRPGTAVSLAVLVPRESTGVVVKRLSSLDPRDDVRILVSGPWPPYSFVGLDHSLAGQGQREP